MAWSYSALKDATAEFGRDKVIEQANLTSHLIDLKQVPGAKKDPAKVFELMKKPQEVGKVIVKSGGFASTGFVADGGTRASSSQGTMAIGTYGFKIVAGAIDFPIGILKVASGGMGIDLWEQAIDSAGGDYGRTLDRSLIGHELGAPDNTYSLGDTTSIGVTDVAGFRIGQTVDQYASNGTTYEGSFVISSISVSSDGTGSLDLASPGLPAGVTTSSRFFMKGSGGDAAPASRSSPVNLADLSNSAIALYSGLAVGDQPAAALDSSTTTLTNATLRRMFTRTKIASGENPTHILVNPLNAERIYNLQVANHRYQNSGNEAVDVYGPSLMFANAKIVEDESQGRKVIDLLNAKSFAAKVHEFWEVAPETDGANSGKWSKDSLDLSQSKHALTLFLSGGLELRVERRNAFARMNALTA